MEGEAATEGLWGRRGGCTHWFLPLCKAPGMFLRDEIHPATPSQILLLAALDSHLPGWGPLALSPHLRYLWMG